MKKLIKVTSLLLATTMAFTACSSKKDKSDDEKEHTVIDVEALEDEEEEDRDNRQQNDTEYVLDRDNYHERAYIEPAPDYMTADYYDEINITTTLLNGDYSVDRNLDGDYSVDDFFANSDFVAIDDLLGTTTFTTADSTTNLDYYDCISVLPYSIRSGSGYNLGYIDDYDFCEVVFMCGYDDASSVDADSAVYTYLYAVQEINNNQLTLRFLSEYSVGDNGIITYQFTGKEITYDLSVRYGKLILSYNGAEVVMSANYLDSTFTAFSEDWNPNSVQIDNITGINYSSDSDNRDDDYFTVTCDNGTEWGDIYYGVARFTEDGVFSFSYTDSDGVSHTHHFVLIKLGYNGFALINEDGVSLFNGWSDNYYEERNDEAGYVGVNVLPEDEAALNGLSQDDIQTLIGLKNEFFDDIEEAFSLEGFSVNVDRDNGTITLDASVLYANNEYEINSDGQAVLDSFTNAILSVLADERYDSLFSQILIQGHTDSNGTYDHNVELSMNRATAVLDYLTAAADAAGSDEANYFSSILVAEGCASDYLVYNDDGTENQEASRRVEFIFYFNLDYLNH